MLRTLIVNLCLIFVTFAQQPANIESSIDGLGLETSCNGTPVWPTCLTASTAGFFNFDVVVGVTRDTFDLYVVSQPFYEFGFANTSFGIIDLKFSDSTFTYLGGFNTIQLASTLWGTPFAVPVSSLEIGDHLMFQALVADVTAPSGYRLSNAFNISR